MPKSPAETAGARSVPWGGGATLTATPDGGFRLQAGDGTCVEASGAATGWALRRATDGRTWWLRGASRGFVLDLREGEGSREEGRISRAQDPPTGAAAILLADGRHFWIVPGVEGSWQEVRGWETPGAYWVARRVTGGWALTPTAAGLHLSGIETVLLLWAAWLLGAEQARNH